MHQRRGNRRNACRYGRYEENQLALLSNTWEITPVAPSPNGPRDAYDVRLWVTGLPGRDVPDFEHRYNVAGWQGGHRDIYRLADSFQMVRPLVDKTFTDILPERAKEPVAPYRIGQSADLCLHFDVIWLHAIVSAFQNSDTVTVATRLFLWVSDDTGYAPDTPSEDLLVRFVSRDLYVSLDEAEAFGLALTQECRDAQQERRRLDLAHFDDVVDF